MADTIATELDLSLAELRVLRAAQLGEVVDFQVQKERAHVHAKLADQTRAIRGELLAQMVRGEGVATRVPIKSVSIRGARIVGKLDLDSTALRCPLTLNSCQFEEPVSFSQASAPNICLNGSIVPALDAGQLSTRGNLELGHGFSCGGGVILEGANIGGRLLCSSARFSNADGPAISADGATVGLDVLCDQGFSANGEVRLFGAHIGGRLQCSGGRFRNSSGPALNADGLTVDHDMYCDEGFTATGEVRLLGAHIGGQLRCKGGQFSNPRGAAINADGLTVDQDMLCVKPFKTNGEVRLLGANVLGQLQFSGGRLRNAYGPTIKADQLSVSQGLFCDAGFIAEGEVSLVGAHIGSVFSCTGGRFSNPSELALNADRLEVIGNMFCDKRFSANGEVRLVGARIGQLKCSGGRFRNPTGLALNADGLIVDHDMYCDKEFSATGEVRLLGAHIGGQLQCSSGRVMNPQGAAVNADGLTVDQDMFCDAGFRTRGTVRLLGAHIEGQLQFSGSKLGNSNDVALHADGLTVDQDMYCDDGFTATGEVSLVGAHLQNLDCERGQFINPTGVALDLEAVEANELVIRHSSLDGGLNLTDARVRLYKDDKKSWPRMLRINGFRYEWIQAGDEDAENNQPAGVVTVGDRLRWLALDHTVYLPQAYDQLASAYRRAGRDSDAQRVAIAKQQRRRAELNPGAKVWNVVLEMTVGYGYRTWLAGVWMLGLLALGTPLFSSAYPSQLSPIHTGQEQPVFQPVLYTLDLLLPVINLQQHGAWIAHGAMQWLVLAFSLAGWILTTAIVLSLSGILKRE